MDPRRPLTWVRRGGENEVWLVSPRCYNAARHWVGRDSRASVTFCRAAKARAVFGATSRCSMFQTKRKAGDRIGNRRCRCGAQDTKYPLPLDLYRALISAAPPGARCYQCAHLPEGKTEAQGG